MNNYYRRLLVALCCTGTVVLAGAINSYADAVVTFEAESGALGANFATTAGSPTYINITTVGGGTNPTNAARVASYTVNFPEAGLYQLYARVRVGPATFDDDSLFYATSFGVKTPSLGSDWVTANGLAGVGFSNSTDVVTGGGALGSGMWKWINLSQFTSQSGFTVNAGNLTQTFQIGARENGLDMDKFAFGTAGLSFTVSNLDTGTLPTIPVGPTNSFNGPDGIAFHRFGPLNNGINSDGANPAAGLTLSGSQLVGATLRGGAQGFGTAFTMSLDGTNFSAFRTFSATPEPNNPRGELSFLGSRFYGTSIGGGGSDVGSIFAGETNGSITVLRSCPVVSNHYATNSGGASPSGSLVLSDGVLYGTASAGGAAANGTIFSLTTNGATFSILRNFSLLNAQTGTNTDGAIPMGGLVLANGTLYGTASAGGTGGNGVVFSIRTNGANFTTLYSFSPMDTQTGTNLDGAMPMAGLVLVSNKLYGTTYSGGIGGRGTIFSLQTNGAGFAVLHHFAATHPATGTNTGGASPSAALYYSDDVLYGTASKGGAGGAGTVFSLNINGTQFAALQNFTLPSSNGTNAFGAFPVAPVMRLGGSLYGTTFSGGPGAAGTVFSIALSALPPPAAPTGLSAGAGNAQVTLNWTASPGATSYNVKRAIVNGGPYTTITNVTTTSHLDTGLVNGTPYYYVVSALNNNGESLDSTQENATPTAPPPPAAPTGLSAGAGNAQVTLNWTASPGATSYNVKRAIVNGGPYTTITNVTTTSHLDTGLVNGTPYYYVVSALNNNGESLDSTQANATPTGPPPSTVITNIVQNPGGSVTLHFLGGPNSTNVIQFTASLVAPITWQNVSTNVADANGAWQFTDGSNGTGRFYRSYAQ